LLRAAFHEGRTSSEKARLVVGEASSGDEAIWVGRAIHGTIKGLRTELGPRAPEAEENWERIVLEASPEEARTIGAAVEVAGIVAERGPATPKPERIAAICMEYLGSRGPPGELYPPEGPDPHADAARMESLREGAEAVLGMLGVEPARPATAPPGARPVEVPPHLRARVAELQEETRRWEPLLYLMPVPDSAPPPPAAVLDVELRELARLLAGWDELLGRTCRLTRELGLWRDAGFGSWNEYCEQALGMDPRTVQNRISLDRRLDRLPELREALRSERLGYEQVRRLALVADRGTVGAWIEKAAGLTVAELERLVDAERQRKISGTGKVELILPESTKELLLEAFQVAREHAGRWIPASTCLADMSKHFLDVWRGEARRRLRLMGHVRRRDGGMCQVPGCTRQGTQEHHIRFRSAGGSDEPDNLITLCAAHHLHALHRGYIRVEGSSSVLLTWWLAGRTVRRSRAGLPDSPLDDLLERLAGLAAA
jgi:hypothetical protein